MEQQKVNHSMWQTMHVFLSYRQQNKQNAVAQVRDLKISWDSCQFSNSCQTFFETIANTVKLVFKPRAEQKQSCQNLYNIFIILLYNEIMLHKKSK